MYYIFKNIDEETQKVTWGIIPEEKITDITKEFAFTKLDKLPDPPANSEGKEYFLDYDAVKKVFFFKL